MSATALKKRRPATPGTNAGTGLPIRGDIQRFAEKLGIKLPNSSTTAVLLPWTYYHRVNIPAAGTQSVTFFTEGKSIGVTNLDNPNQLPANFIFSVRAMRFGFLPGLDRLGNRLGITAPVQATVEASLLNRSSTIATSADPASPMVLWNEKVRELLTQGRVQVNANNRLMHESYGLHTFPEAKGVVTDQNAAISATFTAGAGLASVRGGVFNGAPVASNERSFSTRISIGGGQNFNVAVDWPRAVDFTQQFAGPLFNLIPAAVTAGTLTCELVGELFVPVN